MPKISVLILVYNHEKYIKQCIESVLAQKIYAEIELIIGNDGSTDGSLPIIEELIGSNPEKIILLNEDKNKGMSSNIIQLMNAASGDYIAILDGDDYYLDNHKLQKQLDCFYHDPNLNAVCHNVLLVNEKGEPIKKLNTFDKDYLELKDTIHGRVIHTNAWLIKRVAIHNHIYYRKLLNCNDILLELKLLEKSRVKFINELLSVWRRHDKGMSKSLSLRYQFNNFELLYKTLYKEDIFKKHYALCLENFYKQWAIEILKKESKKVFKIVLKSFFWQIKNLHIDIRFIYIFTKVLIQQPLYKN